MLGFRVPSTVAHLCLLVVAVLFPCGSSPLLPAPSVDIVLVHATALLRSLLGSDRPPCCSLVELRPPVSERLPLGKVLVSRGAFPGEGGVVCAVLLRNLFITSKGNCSTTHCNNNITTIYYLRIFLVPAFGSIPVAGIGK